MSIELAYSERVKAIRAHLGMSVADFAEAMSVSVYSVYKWEEGALSPSEMAMKLMERLGKEKRK